jgi:glycosyltransferase involved in cell wall biosynthesis
MFSTDNTIEIAKEYTQKIFQDSSDAPIRGNIGISKATSDWILCIGATERITQSLKEEIITTVKNEKYVGYHIPRKNYVYGIYMEERPGPLYLFRRGPWRYSCIGGHETIKLNGKIGYLRNFKLHWASPGIEDSVNKINFYTSRDAKTVFANHPNAFFWRHPVKRANLFNMLYRPLVGFFSIYFFAKMYRYGMQGFIVAVMSAFNYFLEIAKLWELQYKKQHMIKDDPLILEQYKKI